MACATIEESYPDDAFSRTDIAKINAAFFDVDSRTAGAALKPVYGKYGAPHIFVKGQMSAVYDSELETLYGTGVASAKFKRPGDVYWEVGGENVFDLVEPIKTAHLIYRKETLPPETDLLNIGALTERGKVFSVFEREIDGRIIITINQTKDLPDGTAFRNLSIHLRGY